MKLPSAREFFCQWEKISERFENINGDLLPNTGQSETEEVRLVSPCVALSRSREV